MNHIVINFYSELITKLKCLCFDSNTYCFTFLTQVAETLVNPMGEDDEDIDINEIIDFNWRVSHYFSVVYF